MRKMTEKEKLERTVWSVEVSFKQLDSKRKSGTRNRKKVLRFEHCTQEIAVHKAKAVVEENFVGSSDFEVIDTHEEIDWENSNLFVWDYKTHDRVGGDKFLESQAPEYEVVYIDDFDGFLSKRENPTV